MAHSMIQLSTTAAVQLRNTGINEWTATVPEETASMGQMIQFPDLAGCRGGRAGQGAAGLGARADRAVQARGDPGCR
jgi:hypothetical protein